MSQRNNPERYSRQGKHDPQEQYSPSHRKWGWSRSRRTNDTDAAPPRITSVASVNALPSSRSASLTNAATPAERMAAARYAGAPPLPQRAPDDMPALSTARKMGSALQRFSGTGVASTSAVQRQEQRARVITLSLVSMAVVLIVVSAFLLFNPTVRHVGFGLTPGNRVVTVTSTAAVILYQSATPQPATPTPAPATPAPGSKPGATATPQPKATATATPRPTATLRPTATTQPTVTPIPTATPIPYGGSASVTFTRTSQQINTIPTTIAASDSYSFNAANGTIASRYVTFSGLYYSGSSPTIVTLINLGLGCSGNEAASCFVTDQTINQNGGYCHLSAIGIPNKQSVTVNCTNVTGRADQQYNFNNANVFVDSCFPASCGVTAYNSTIAARVMPGNCQNYGYASQVRNYATGQADNSLNSQGLSTTISGPNTSLGGVYCSNNSCAQAYGGGAPVSFGSFGNCVTVSGWRYTYNAGDAIQLQKDRIASAVQSGYTLTSENVCGSPTVPTYNAGNRTATISCPASGVAYYIWNGTNEAALQSSLVGKSKAQAQNICNSTPGVASGTCNITITGGSVMPQSPGNIQISPTP